MTYRRPRSSKPFGRALVIRNLTGLGVVVLGLVGTSAVFHHLDFRAVEEAAEQTPRLEALAALD